MTPQQFVLAVQSALTPLVDEARAEAMKAYLLNQFEFLGLPAPVRRAAVKGIGKVQWQHADDLLTAAELLWQKPEREYRYTAVDLLRAAYFQVFGKNCQLRFVARQQGVDALAQREPVLIGHVLAGDLEHLLAASGLGVRRAVLSTAAASVFLVFLDVVGGLPFLMAVKPS